MADKIYLKNDFVKKIYITEFGEFKPQTPNKLFTKICKRIKKFIEEENSEEKKSDYNSTLNGIFSGLPSTKNYKLKASRKLLNTQKQKSRLTEKEARLIVESYGCHYYSETQDQEPEKLTFDITEKNINSSQETSQEIYERKIPIFDKGEMELELFRIITNASKELFFFFSKPEMKMLFNYIISIVGIKRKKPTLNINVVFYDTNVPNIVHSYRKLRHLKYLGCNVASLNYTANKKIPFIGVMSDPEDSDYCKMLSIDNTNGNHILLDNNFEFLISPLFTTLKQEFNSRIEKYKNFYVSDIIIKSPSEYIKLLQRVKHYSGVDKSKFAIVDFKTSQIGAFLCHEKMGVKEYKIKQHEFFSEISNSIVSDATFAFKYYKSNYDHVINLPIVEFVGGKYYISDGHTRLYLAYKKYLTDQDVNSTIKIVIIEMFDHACLVGGHSELSDLTMISKYQKEAGNKGFARDIEKETHTSFEYNWSVHFPFSKPPNWTKLV